MTVSFYGVAQVGVNAPGVYSGKEFSVRNCYRPKPGGNHFGNDSAKIRYVFRGERIWRSIGLESRENRELLSSASNCARVGLFEVIKFGIREQRLNVFSTDDFTSVSVTRIEPLRAENLLRKRDSSMVTTYDATGEPKEELVVVNRYLTDNDIKSYLLKEDWIFDSKLGKTRRFIVAIAPLIFDEKSGTVVPLFWLYYPEWEDVFASFYINSPFNGDVVTYATVFSEQHFISKISKQNNLYDRDVKSYLHGKDVGDHDQKLKENVIKNESDLFGE